MFSVYASWGQGLDQVLIPNGLRSTDSPDEHRPDLNASGGDIFYSIENDYQIRDVTIPDVEDKLHYLLGGYLAVLSHVADVELSLAS